MNARHVRNERVAFRHIPDLLSHLPRVLPDILAKYACRATFRLIEAEKRMDKRSLSSSVRTEKTYRSTFERTLEVIQDRPLAEPDAEVVELYDWGH